MSEPKFEAASKLVQNNENMEPREVAAKVSELEPKFTYIDHGLSRIVFTINHPVYENVVLKIARGKRGIKSNKNESDNYRNLRNTKYEEWLCPVYSISDDNSYLLMDKVDMSKGNYVPVLENLAEIFSTEEISSHNVGFHPQLGNVLIDYTF